MEQKYQIFISSTYKDLIEERSLASLTVLRASHIPAGMELSSGANENTLDVIYRWIDASDVFVLILGRRYGDLSPIHGLSYTHLEYNHALSRRIPIIVILLTDKYINTKVTNGKIQATEAFERSNADKLTAFRQSATSEKYCLLIDDVSAIEATLLRAISAVERTFLINGWVRRQSCLALVADAYSQYINLYLSIMTTDDIIDDHIVILILQALQHILNAVICTGGWIDIVIPTKIDSNDIPNLLIAGIDSDSNWLRVRYSSVPRSNVPTLIPIEVNGIPWRGSGAAFKSKGIDYIGDFTNMYPSAPRH